MSAAALAEAIPAGPAATPAVRRCAMRLRVRYVEGARSILFLDSAGYLHLLAWAYDPRACPADLLALLPVHGEA